MSVINCKCCFAKIIQHINCVVMETGHKLIELDQFKDILKTNGCIEQINTCLIKHGFKGKIEKENDNICYIE